MTTEARSETGRAASKRHAILDAATTLFLEQGYLGTSMDEVAAAARVSKQTVYKHFIDKERLFAEAVLRTAERSDHFIATTLPMLREAEDVASALEALARAYVEAVTHPRVLKLRRLVIGEAARFPDLAGLYYERVPQRVLDALADGLAALGRRGVLRIDHAPSAASHLAFLIVGQSLDHAMFHPDDEDALPDVERLALDGVRTFLAAYGA